MFRRGHKGFFIILFVLCLSVILKPYQVFTQETFLNLPFSTGVKLLQGWYYTVLVNGSKDHGATDYDCELGEPILAAADGLAMASVQLDSRTKRGYGNFVLIKHKNGYATLYGHLRKAADHLKYYPTELRSNTNYSEWTPIEKSEYIGDCGTSGTDNVHLHFEVTTGKYAVDRIDSYDLYDTKQFYPPNASYIALGKKHLWMSDPPQYLEAKIAHNQTSETFEEKKSILDTIKNWFAPEVISENKVEQKKEELGLSFVDRKISLSSNFGEDIQVVVQAKNTGSRVWKRQEISLNVIGGREVNSLFRHPTWITDLRPTLLDNTEVKPGETGKFSFIIKGLDHGSYTLKIMAVEVGTWKQVGSGNVQIELSVSEPLKESIEEVKKETVVEGVIHGIKEFAETVVEKVVDVIKSVPIIFSGSSGGGSSETLNENTEPVSENFVEDQIVVEEDEDVREVDSETETIPVETKEVLFNEIAWSGSSGVCSDHEWIELYNPLERPQLLQNWKLEVSVNGIVQTTTLSGMVEGHGYYLISHPNTFTTVVVPDNSLPEHMQLSDTGARLILKNQDGDIVDSIDQSQGWIGGSMGVYPHTLERVSDAGTSTWKSSDSVRYGVQSGNCGQITGSPRMKNSGYAFISDETLGFYPKNNAGNVVLTQEESPYLFSSFTIPREQMVEIDSGIVFAGISSESKISVQGELIIRGDEFNPVVITSRHDQEMVTTSALFSNILTGAVAQAGDWQNIEVVESGKLIIEHGRLKYGGNRFGTSVSCQGCGRSQMITNLGGFIILKDVEIENGFEIGSGSGPDALVYSSGGMVDLQNVKLHHGKRALHSGGNTEMKVDLVEIHDFDLSDKVIFVEQQMPSVWKKIQFTGNTPLYAYSPTLIVTSSYTLSPDHAFEFSTVSVEPQGELILDGGNLYAKEITIKGKLSSGANENISEIGGGHSPSSTFSRILFSAGSSGNLSNVKIQGGGYFQSTSAYPFSSPRPYMIWVDGATVSISHTQLINSRRPGGMVVVRNGNLDIQDSEIGWYSGYNKLSSFLEYGVVMNNQSVGHIENIDFRKMDYVVELNQGSTLTHDRMSKTNFIDLYPAFFPSKNWYPTTIFPF